jgi:hypothetical protein
MLDPSAPNCQFWMFLVPDLSSRGSGQRHQCSFREGESFHLHVPIQTNHLGSRPHDALLVSFRCSACRPKQVLLVMHPGPQVRLQEDRCASSYPASSFCSGCPEFCSQRREEIIVYQALLPPWQKSQVPLHSQPVLFPSEEAFCEVLIIQCSLCLTRQPLKLAKHCQELSCLSL